MRRANPMFSILLPSRNRLELLRHAIASVIAQGDQDIEIIVADNASSDDYASYLSQLSRVTIVYERCDTPISVTANWNRALGLADGEYVIMLGDDDALTPNLLRDLRAIIERFDRPEVVYMMAYHYAYPGVFPHAPAGYFRSVNNSPLFDMAKGPFLLEPEVGRRLARKAFRFRHDISFNAQHYVWRRDFMSKNARETGFFQSPYPDYYASFVTFFAAERMVVLPSPRVIIEISRSSFGFYYANNREQEGAREFFTEAISEQALSEGDDAIEQALRCPGSPHYRNWLIAVLCATQSLPRSLGLRVDHRRYRRIQSLELAFQAGFDKTMSRSVFWQQVGTMDPRDRRFARLMFWLLVVVERMSVIPRHLVKSMVNSLSRIYHFPSTITYDIGPHETILDAYRWLETKAGAVTVSTSGE